MLLPAANVLSVDTHVGAHLILAKAPRQQFGWGVWRVHGGALIGLISQLRKLRLSGVESLARVHSP